MLTATEEEDVMAILRSTRKTTLLDSFTRRTVLEDDHTIPAEFDAARTSLTRSSEKRLMLAVMEEGIDCYLKYAAAKSAHGQNLAAEAEAWVETDNPHWPFSFDRICEVFGFDVELVRCALRARRVRALGGERLRLKGASKTRGTSSLSVVSA